MTWFGKKKIDKTQGELGILVLEVIHDGVVIVDAGGKIKLINPAARGLLGIGADEGLGLEQASLLRFVDKTNTLIAPELNPIAIVAKNRRFLESRELNLLKVRGSGATPVMLTVSVLNEAHGDLVVTLRDITRELKEEQEKNEFISTASHEMRTPVASIEGYLSLAINPQTATVDARGMSYLMKAHEASQHLGRLFRDLLDTTQLDDGHMKAKYVPVEMTALIQNIAEAQMPSIRAKGLQFLFNVPKMGIKEEKQKLKLNPLLYASVDVDFMHEAVGNLLENAIKYTKAGKIAVNVSGDERNVYVQVSDSGIGIPSSELPYVFQKFYRVDNSDTRDIGGTGLGLYLTKQRVEAMRGQIRAESELEKGSSFILTFPRISEDEYAKQKLAIDNAKMLTGVNATGRAQVQTPKVIDQKTVPQRPPVPTQQIEPDANPRQAQAPDASVAGAMSPEQLAVAKQTFAKQVGEDGQ